MRLLIGYDGSDCAEWIFTDLERAGLPEKAEAVILSVAETWLPPAMSGEIELSVAVTPPAVERAIKQAESKLAEAREIAANGARLLARRFPGWDIRHEATADSPAWGVLKLAGNWMSDLIVVGSHGYSGFNAFSLGSVSNRIVTESDCSVRVSRLSESSSDEPPVIVIGIDGSEDAELAVARVASRQWPAGTVVHLVCAIDEKISTQIIMPSESIKMWIEETDEDPIAWVGRMIADYRDRLEASGLRVHTLVNPGNPKRILLDAAAECRADSIFIGANGHTILERLILGSVSSSIVNRAKCSVEVVRASRGRKN